MFIPWLAESSVSGSRLGQNIMLEGMRQENCLLHAAIKNRKRRPRKGEGETERERKDPGARARDQVGLPMSCPPGPLP